MLGSMNSYWEEKHKGNGEGQCKNRNTLVDLLWCDEAELTKAANAHNHLLNKKILTYLQKKKDAVRIAVITDTILANLL